MPEPLTRAETEAIKSKLQLARSPHDLRLDGFTLTADIVQWVPKAIARIEELEAFVRVISNVCPPEAEPFDDDGPICAECGTHVAVREGHDFDPGDLCDNCAQVSFGKVKAALAALKGSGR